jgi:hypothetical protein
MKQNSYDTNEVKVVTYFTGNAAVELTVVNVIAVAVELITYMFLDVIVPAHPEGG